MQTSTETGELETRVKIVVVGNDATGKKSLFDIFTGNDFPKASPPVLDYHYVDIYSKGKDQPIKLSLLCSLDHTFDDNVKKEFYCSCHVVIICFSLVDNNSAYDIESKWVQEVRKYCGQNIPIILVGCKKDLRDKELESKKSQLTVELENTSNKLLQMLVSKQEGESIAKAIKASCYMECSAMTRDGVTETLEAAANEAAIYKSQMCKNQQAKEVEKDDKQNRNEYDLCVYEENE